MNAFERYTLAIFARKTLENALDAGNHLTVMAMSRLVDSLCLFEAEISPGERSSTSA